MTRIKCCGMFRTDDIKAVNQARPDFCGFIIDVPTSHRNVTTEMLTLLRSLLDPNIPSVGVFVNAEPHLIADLYAKGLIDIAQLHGSEYPAYIEELRELTEQTAKTRTTNFFELTEARNSCPNKRTDNAQSASHPNQLANNGQSSSSTNKQTNDTPSASCPNKRTSGIQSNKRTNEPTKGIPLIQAFKVESLADITRAEASAADMILLDAGRGSGRTFNWELAQNIHRPFMMAGGLTPENLSSAITHVHPWGVDLSSGLETNKLKDPHKIQAAVQAARESRTDSS